MVVMINTVIIQYASNSNRAALALCQNSYPKYMRPKELGTQCSSAFCGRAAGDVWLHTEHTLKHLHTGHTLKHKHATNIQVFRYGSHLTI